jgi:hypothetical protein
VLAILDFETFYSTEYQLKKLTTESYVRDPRFQVIGAGVRIPETGFRRWFEADEFGEWVADQDWSQLDTLAHHAHFDNAILTWHFGVRPRRIWDTLSMARALHGVDVGGSLAVLAQHYEVGTKGDEVLNALGKRRSDFTPEEWLRYGEYCLNDVDLTWALFGKMRPSFPEDELELIDHTVRMFTEPVLTLDRPRLEKYLAFEQTRKQELLDRIGATRDLLLSNDKLKAKFEELGVECPMKDGKKGPIPALAKSDAGFQDLLEHERDDIRYLAEARLAVKSTINETRTGRLLGIAERGPLPVYLRYSGAHTGRDAGGDKINPQNFQRGGEIRACITAPDGSVVLEADSAQIEARGNGWLSGHTALVEAFAQNRDVYSETASGIYGRKIDRKANPEDEVPGQVGKSSTLGLGYGMGYAKFAGVLLAGPFGAPPIQFGREMMDQLGIRLGDFLENPYNVKRVREMRTRLAFEDLLVHCAITEEIVRRYRANNAPIVNLWRALDGWLPLMESGDTGGAHLNLAAWPVKDGIRLASGRRIRYSGLRRHTNDWGKTEYTYRASKRKPFEKLYGAKILENIDQALARDLVFSQALSIHRETGRKPVLRTHDSLTYVVRETEAEAVLACVMANMRRVPKWAEGWPVNVEGGFGPNLAEVKKSKPKPAPVHGA